MQCNSIKLVSVDHINNDGLINMLESNLKMYYDYALLSIGGWSDVEISTQPSYGGNLSVLSPVDDPNYSFGQVWQAPRKDFVWEQQINYIDENTNVHNPLVVGVPQMDGYPNPYSYYVNYPEGQIIFESAQPTDSDMRLSYSYRYTQIYTPENAGWWKSLQANSYKFDTADFINSEGDWSLFGENRVQMPAIVVEGTPNGTSRGWELGSNSKIVTRVILFHIYAETQSDCKNLADIFSLQNDRTLPLFNTNEVTANSAGPLDYRGELLNPLNDYAKLRTNYPWKSCRMIDSTIRNTHKIHQKLYNSVVQTSMEVIL